MLAYALAWVEPWQAAAAAGVVALLVLVAIDLALLRDPLEIVRCEPPRLALARRDAFSYDVRNRGGVARTVALVEAPAARLAIDTAEARTVVPPRSRVTVQIGVVPRERGRTALRSYHARIRSPLGIVELRRAYAVPVDLPQLRLQAVLT